MKKDLKRILTVLPKENSSAHFELKKRTWLSPCELLKSRADYPDKEPVENLQGSLSEQYL